MGAIFSELLIQTAGGGINVATLTDDYTVSTALDGMSAQFHQLTPSGANRNFILPDPSEGLVGCFFIVGNDAASGGYSVPVRGKTLTAGGTLSSVSTIGTLAPGMMALSVCYWDGTYWRWSYKSFSPAADLTLAGTLSAVAAAFTGRVTTTDGVGSGTARVVGGVASVATTAGTLGPTGGTAETTLQSYTIPANTLKAGTVLRVVATTRCTAETGTTTFTGKLKLGSTALVTMGAFDLAAGDYQRIELEIVSRAAPSGSAAVVVTGTALGLAAGAAVSNAIVLAPANYATNGALVLALTGQMSASDANAVASDQFVVEVIG